MQTRTNNNVRRRRVDNRPLFAFLFAIAIIFGGISVFQGMTDGDRLTEAGKIAEEARKKRENTPVQLDLQLPVNQWVAAQKDSDNSGIIIYDLDNEAVVARHNESKNFRIESIYKMFVAYEGYYRIDHNIYNADDTALDWNSFDGKPYTLELCLDHMVRYSFSNCAEVVWKKIGRSNLQSIYENKGFKNTDIAGFTSTPEDIMKLYQMYWKHEDLSDDSWSKIKDSMLNQTAPKSASDVYTKNWRMGLPSGFATAKVYNKVGWYGDESGWKIYDDAALLEFPETTNNNNETKPARHFIIIALTKNTSPKELVKLSRKIESTIKTADSY